MVELKALQIQHCCIFMMKTRIKHADILVQEIILKKQTIRFVY
jgi:hypothetical protein